MPSSGHTSCIITKAGGDKNCIIKTGGNKLKVNSHTSIITEYGKPLMDLMGNI